MKRVFKLVAVVALMASCAQKESTDSQYGEGLVRFECAAQQTVSETTKAATYELPSELIPNGEEFSLALTGTYVNPDTQQSDDFSANYSTVRSYNESLPPLTAGDYHAAISYGDISIEGADNACFAGELDFEVVARKTSNETIAASLANSAIRLSTTEWFDKYYADAEFTIVTAAGNEFNFEPHGDEIIFVQPNSKLVLKGSAVKSQTGVAVDFPANTIGTTSVRTLNTIVVDASQAGGASISISFDQTLTEVKLDDCELNPEV